MTKDTTETYLEVYLKSPGIIFNDPIKNKTNRTPYRFYIKKSQRTVYEAMIRNIPLIRDYEINDCTKVPETTTKKERLSLIKPKSDIDISVKFNG